MSRIITYPEAIQEAIEQEMDRDDSVVILGQGVDDPKARVGSTFVCAVWRIYAKLVKRGRGVFYEV